MAMSFERSLDTETVLKVVRAVNDELTYVEGAGRAQMTVERFKAILPTVLRILAREQIEFGRHFGLGIKRMTEPDKAHKTEANKKKLTRAAGRAEKHAANIKLEMLGPREQLMVTTNRTVFNMIRRAARAKPEKLAAAVVKPPVIDTAKIIALKKA